MARFSGVVGYAEDNVELEDSPGTYVDVMIERRASGDVVRNSRELREGEYLNNDLSVGNSISIIADAYAREHFFAIRYVKWAGVLWTVEDVAVEHPRLLLRLGGVYNGPSVTESEENSPSRDSGGDSGS